jgi:cell wall-associated NlpC family hydrolase
MKPLNDADAMMIDELQGKPWTLGANGPDTFDCWGLVRHIYKQVFDIELPVIQADHDSALYLARFMKQTEHRKRLKQVQHPCHGAVVLMSGNNHPTHVGVYLEVDRGGILHCMESAGVRFDRVATLPQLGWGQLSYYEWH